MKAQLHKKNGISIINISGKLEMDKAEPLKKVCLEEFVGQKVIFSLSQLSFVGSSGIKTFFQIFRELKENHAQLKFVGLRSDFIRLIELTENHTFEVHETVEMAINSFLNPENPSTSPQMISPLSFKNQPNLDIQDNEEISGPHENRTFNDKSSP